MLSRKVFSTLRAVWVVSMLATLLVFDNIPAVVSCSGPSPNPQTAATAAGTCAAAKVQQQLSSAANTVTSNVEPFGVPKDKTSPAFKAKATTTTAQVPTTSPILVRGGALVETTSSDEVDEIVQEASINELLVVIDFTASWCGPCKAIAPLYKELSEEYDTVIFLKVDVDEDPDTAAKYSVSAMPTFLFVKNGKVIDRLQGANPQKLRDLVEEYM